MSIDYLGCAYSQNFSVKFNGKKKDILAMKWFAHFSNGTWKTYQVTLYNHSNQKKYGTIFKAFSPKSKKEYIETTYIQINNLGAVKQLQKRKDSIKINVIFKEPKDPEKFDPFENNSEDHYIDPKAFVDTKKLLFPNPDPKRKTQGGLPNYFEIKEYLTKHINKQIKKSPAEDEIAEKKDDKENILSSSDLVDTPTYFRELSSKIQFITSSCCNLKLVAGIILALSVSMIGSLAVKLSKS